MSDSIERHAYFDAARRHRLMLTRRWGAAESVTWVMLNPSTADDQGDDATMRRVIGYSRTWGYGGCRVFNLFTLITPDPRVLVAAVRAGERNRSGVLRSALRLTVDHVVVAWGANANNPTLRAAAPPVAAWAREHDVRLQCLGVTLSGQPLHPLRLNKKSRLRAWDHPESKETRQ